MARSTTAQVRDRDRQVTVSSHQTDAPILPMAQLEKLHAIAPDRVPWVFEETTKEGQFRRSETTRVNTFVFIERMVGVIAGLFMGCAALYASYSLGMAGHDVVAAVIGGTTVVGLVSAFVIGAKRKASNTNSNGH